MYLYIYMLKYCYLYMYNCTHVMFTWPASLPPFQKKSLSALIKQNKPLSWVKCTVKFQKLYKVSPSLVFDVQ